MDLRLGPKLGEGGFSDVYEATDALGRKVAVKIIRMSATILSSALEHAKALARTKHPNVVSIFALEKVQDPESGKVVDAIVMELLSGESLSARLHGAQFTVSEVTMISLGLVAGLRHIHSQGLSHGDLHAENVIVSEPDVKIIDILYRDSLAFLSNASKETLLRKDLLNLRLLLYDILLTSELNPINAAEFNAKLGGAAPSIDEIESALKAVLDPSQGQDEGVFIEHSLSRIRDEGFVEGDAYAKALADETPEYITKPFLLRLVEQSGIQAKHRPYIRLLWDRLPGAAKREVGIELARKLDREIPSGYWGSPINILAAFGREGWASLPRLTQLRLESAITNDILAGQHDIYKATPGNPGTLGTYTNTFWAYFHDRDRVLDNIVAKLKTNWNGQNYIGKYLMVVLGIMADTPERRKRAIDALQYAVRNDSKVVVEKLETFPIDWQRDILSPTD